MTHFMMMWSNMKHISFQIPIQMANSSELKIKVLAASFKLMYNFFFLIKHENTANNIWELLISLQ